MTRCPTCETTWHGLTECHCASCHAHFGNVEAFDKHRVGSVDTRSCADPETLTTKTGRKPLMGVDRHGRKVWVKADTRPHPHARQRKDPPTATGIQEPTWRPLDAPSALPATVARPSRCPDVEVTDPGESW